MSKFNKLNFFQRTLAKVTGIDKLTEATSSTKSDTGWRRLTDNNNLKGLSIVARDRQYKLVYKMFLTNPMAKWILQTQNQFVIGDGLDFEIQIKEDIVKDENRAKELTDSGNEILNKFWDKNKLDLSIPKKILDLSLNGCLCMPVSINPIDGSVILGFVDPSNIEKVNVNPLNIEEVISLKLKQDMSGKEKTMNAIRMNYDFEQIESESFGLLEGDCFYFAINNVTNQPEGISDLMAIVDYLDIQDQMLWGILQHVIVQNTFVLDVTINDADEEDIKKWEADNPVPKGPARIVHNQDIKMDIHSPQVQGTESKEMFSMIKSFNLGAFSIPEHWYGDGSQTNLATAIEQSTPTFKRLKERQQYIIFIWETILTFVLHKAFNKKEGFNATRAELSAMIIKVKVPEFETRNLKEITDSFDTLTDAITKGVVAGYITPESGAAAYRLFMQLTGYEMDEQAEIAKLEDLKKKAEMNPEPNVPDPEDKKPDNKNGSANSKVKTNGEQQKEKTNQG